MRALVGATYVSSCLMLGACVAVDPEPGLQEVKQHAEKRAGVEVVWVRSDEDRARVAELVGDLNRDGLTRDEAARVAVLSDPVLQARLADIGVTAADVAQASLLTNPTVDFYWAFPADSGNTTLGVAGWLSDIWTMPRRKRLAEMDALMVQYGVALDVMRTAIAAAAAWDELVAARRDLELVNQTYQALANIAVRRQIRFDHGLDDVGLLQTAIAREADELAMLQRAEQRVTRATNDLDRRLAQEGAAQRIAADVHLLAYQPVDRTLQETIDIGMEERLDILIAQARIERQLRSLGFEEAMTWNSVALGFTSDGRFSDLVSSDASLGPQVTVEVPIFDHNQAGKARARFEIQRSEEQLRATQWRAATDLDTTYQAYTRARSALDQLESRSLPASMAGRAYAAEWNSKMQLSFLHKQEAQLSLLDTQRRVLAARQRLNQTYRDQQIALRGAAVVSMF